MALAEIPTRPFEDHRFLGRLNLHAGTPPSQFILYNHVTDYYYYGSAGHSFLPMRRTLITYLQSLGYTIIAVYNTSEGLVFSEPEMELRYRELTTGGARRVSYGRRAESDGVSGASPAPQPAPTQTPGQIIAGLGTLLRQPGREPGEIERVGVIIERVQNIISTPPTPEDRQLLDQIQSWSLLTNGNVSLLLGDVGRVEELPTSLIGLHRSGVSLINVGLPTQSEINQLFISAENGWLTHEFGEAPLSPASARININELQRRDLMGRLDVYDTVTIRGFFNECARRGIAELNLRTLRMITTHTSDVWSVALDDGNLQHVAEKFRKVRGQDYAIQKVMGAFRVMRDNLRYQVETGQVEERLLAYFFFAGPTGVGKTEVFRVLTEAFPQIRSRKFNMPEYREEHSSARFFGAPPGYVGYGRGELGEFLIQNPAAIVLFDEFEKAHPNVWKNFLTMLEGSLTTGDGVRVDLSQAIFIFTSNAGSADLLPIHSTMPLGQQENLRNQNRDIVQGALRQAGAPPELIGRLLESIISFNHLNEEVIQEIIQLNLDRLAQQSQTQFDASVEAFLLDLYAHQGHLGARLIKQHIDNTLKADILRISPPRGIIYKDIDGLTQHTRMHPAATYRRQVTPKERVSRAQVHADVSSDRTFRDSVSPAVVAILTFDNEGNYRGSGTGFFVTDTGYIVTNRHVIAQCPRICAVHGTGQIRTELTIVGLSDYFDLCVLKPTQPFIAGVPFLSCANSGSVQVDTEVITFGFPHLEYSPDTDRLSFTIPERSERGYIGVRLEAEQFFRLSGVGLKRGSSGGPLFQVDDGRLIGVVIAQQTTSEGMSFAIMSSTVQAFLQELGIIQPFTRLDQRYSL